MQVLNAVNATGWRACSVVVQVRRIRWLNPKVGSQLGSESVNPKLIQMWLKKMVRPFTDEAEPEMVK